MSWVKFGAVLLGGAFGAVFAILSIEFFHSTVNQLGYVAAVQYLAASCVL